jgi:hypothetical protein
VNDADIGRNLRDAGMEAVEENSGEWKDLCKQYAHRWFEAQPAETVFTGEIIRLAFQSESLPDPHHPNAWGAVIGGCLRSWLKSNRAAFVGVSPGRDPKAHARLMLTYKKL